MDDFVPDDIQLKVPTDIGDVADALNDSKAELISLGFTTERYNFDKHVNKNGSRLIDTCKNFDIHFINGRFGDDLNRGKLTCDNASSIDYAIASPSLFSKIVDFRVDTFDKFLSDKHNPICLSLSCSSKTKTHFESKSFVETKGCAMNSNGKFTNSTIVKKDWDKNMSAEYMSSFSTSDIQDLSSLIEHIESLNTDNVDQSSIDELSETVCKIYMKPAIDTGLAKTTKRNGNSNRPKLTNPTHKPWFTKECRLLRSDYLKTKRKLKRSGTQIAKIKLHEKSLIYKRSIRKAKREFSNKFQTDLRNMKSSNPREYWKTLNDASSKSRNVGDVDTSSLFTHFSNLNQSRNSINMGTDFDPRSINHGINEEINRPIVELEIRDQIKKLKNNKSAGSDSVTNELIKNSPDLLISTICQYFNLILNTGIVPSDWTKGIIKPIFKNRGSPNDPDNYRGITLLSCIGKLFTSIINSRLSQYIEALGILGDEQAGFREGYSTIDHVFTLHAIIDLYLHKRKRVYCAFIDYKKAFDLIDRSSLWGKLISSGINGKIVTVIYNMYANAKSCIKNGHETSDFFNCNIGVRQGENLSPLLFAMYLNDFELFISKYYKGLTEISKDINNHLSDDDVEVFLKLFTLLYADDTIVFAESGFELQSALNAVFDYCQTWHLTVNTSKTKIVIFSRGKVKKCENFKFGDDHIETVSDFNYLGIKFNYNNRVKSSIIKQVAQAKRAMYSLITKARKLDLPIDIQLDLFDHLVTPILLYGCEVWGFADLVEVEKLYLRFCKLILRIRTNTSSCMVYGEIGRCAMRTVIERRLIMYWFKLANTKSSKLSNIMYRLTRTLFDKGIYQSPWLCKVKSILDKTGLSYIWNSDVELINPTWLKSTLKQTLHDMFIQEWNAEVFNKSSCLNYRIFKSELQLENYLITLTNRDRINLCKFRCGNSKLPIVTGRYQGIERDDRICSLCDRHQLGDEFHYLFECNFFAAERKKYLRPFYRVRPNTLKMCKLMNNQNRNELSNLVKFCCCIMKTFN